jgi:hypothetical protein
LCPSVKNILLLDSEGKRVAVKYYSDDWPTNSSKLAFEKSVFTKTLKSNARVEGMTQYISYNQHFLDWNMVSTLVIVQRLANFVKDM